MSSPSGPPRRKEARNHLRSYQATYMGRDSVSPSGTNASRNLILRSSLQQQRQRAQKDLALSHPPTPLVLSMTAPVPKTGLSRSATAPTPAPKIPSSLFSTAGLVRSSSNPNGQIESSTRSVRWSSTASVRTIDPAPLQDKASHTDDDSTSPSISKNSTQGSIQTVASPPGHPSTLHVKQRRTLQEIRDEVERIQKARAGQSASTKSSGRSTKNRSIISNVPEEYSVPITDGSREGKLAARIPGDNASSMTSNEPLTTACESFKSCSSNISQLSTVPFAAMDTAVVSGLRIGTTKGIGSDATSNASDAQKSKALSAVWETSPLPPAPPKYVFPSLYYSAAI